MKTIMPSKIVISTSMPLNELAATLLAAHDKHTIAKLVERDGEKIVFLRKPNIIDRGKKIFMTARERSEARMQAASRINSILDEFRKKGKSSTERELLWNICKDVKNRSAKTPDHRLAESAFMLNIDNRIEF